MDQCCATGISLNIGRGDGRKAVDVTFMFEHECHAACRVEQSPKCPRQSYRIEKNSALSVSQSVSQFQCHFLFRICPTFKILRLKDKHSYPSNNQSSGRDQFNDNVFNLLNQTATPCHLLKPLPKVRRHNVRLLPSSSAPIRLQSTRISQSAREGQALTCEFGLSYN